MGTRFPLSKTGFDPCRVLQRGNAVAALVVGFRYRSTRPDRLRNRDRHYLERGLNLETFFSSSNSCCSSCDSCDGTWIAITT